MSRILRFFAANTFLLALCSFFLIGGAAQAATVLFPSGGGLGSNAAPTLGKIPVGTSGGVYVPTSTISGPITINGTSILATTTTAVLNGVIVVTSKTDAAVISAISRCGSNGIGRVYIPSGFYSLSNTPVVPSNCLVSGDGTTSILSLPSNKTILFNGVTNSGLQNVHVDCVRQVAGNVCVDVKNSSNIDIDHSLVTNAQGFGVFVHSDGISTTSNIRITNNYMTGLGNNDLIGGGPSDSTGFDTVTGVLVDGNYLSQDTTSGTTYEFVFDIVAARHTTFTNNFVKGKIAYGFEQTQNYSDEFSDNDLQPAIGGTFAILSLQSSTSPLVADKGIIVSGNRITHGEISVTGDVAAKLTNLILCNNTIYSADAQNGIDLTNVSLSNICNNTITGSRLFDNGIKLTNSDNTAIHDNIISTYGTAINDTQFNSTNSIYNNIYNNIGVTNGVVNPVVGRGWYNFVGNLFGLGTSSPFANLSLQANNGDANTTLFAIGSSTASATSTLFSISNIGSTTIGNFGQCSGTNALTTNSSGTIVCGAITGSGNTFPFTPTSYGNATGTTLGLLNGFTSPASSTIAVASTLAFPMAASQYLAAWYRPEQPRPLARAFPTREILLTSLVLPPRNSLPLTFPNGRITRATSPRLQVRLPQPFLETRTPLRAPITSRTSRA
jgi:hypothetical protein